MRTPFLFHKLIGRNRRILLSAVILLGVSFAAYFLYSPISQTVHRLTKEAHRARVSAALPQAKSLWEDQKIQDYNIDVKGYDLLTQYGCMIDTTLVVRKDKLVGFLVSENPYDTELAPVLREFDPDDPDALCPYDEFRVSQFYGRIERDLAIRYLGVLDFVVEFDNEFGFVSRYRRYCDFSDCSADLTFSNFIPNPDVR